MAKRDYYEILEVTRSASDEELKKAYRKLAVQFHPDRNPGDKAAEDKFKELNEAYQILSEPKRRMAYDQFGHAGVGGSQGFDPSGFSSGSFTDIFDNIFGDIFGGGSQGGGVDLRYNLEITFEEAAFGVEKKISFEKETSCETCSGSGAKPGTKPVICRTCQGSGQVKFNQGFFTLARTCAACAGRGSTIGSKCETCKGKGRTQKPHTVTVKVPAGIDTDQRLRLKGDGEVGNYAGRTGDLYVHIHVQEHALFKREAEHVILDLPITFAQAALGAEIEVPTLSGSTPLTIRAGTQPGETLRLKGKGIKRLNGSGHGDQFIRIGVEIPKHLSGKQKELLREFDKEASKDCQPLVNQFVQKFKEIFK